jgi:hypothetical protein
MEYLVLALFAALITSLIFNLKQNRRILHLDRTLAKLRHPAFQLMIDRAKAKK